MKCAGCVIFNCDLSVDVSRPSAFAAKKVLHALLLFVIVHIVVCLPRLFISNEIFNCARLRLIQGSGQFGRS